MKNNNIKIGSNKSFGLVFFIFFLIVSFYPLVNGEDIRKWSLVFSIIFLVLGLTNSKILNPLNKLWFNFGIFLGKIMSPLIMGIIFFFSGNTYRFVNEIIRKRYFKFKI